jgi:hypothetical protein
MGDKPQIFAFAGTTPTLAVTARFVVRDHFVEDIANDAVVRISRLSEYFRQWFLDKIEGPLGRTKLHYFTLLTSSPDVLIIGWLGGVIKAETALAEVFALMKTQPNSENGPLLTNGHANVFYVRDAGDRLRAVSVSWGGRGWSVIARAAAHPYEWHGAERIFSRNS